MRSFISALLWSVCVGIVGCAPTAAAPPTITMAVVSESTALATPSRTTVLVLPTETATPTVVTPEPTPLPGLRFGWNPELGIAGEYRFDAADISMAGNGGAFGWTQNAEDNGEAIGHYPALIFVPTNNLAELRPLDANKPVALAVAGLQENVVTGSADGEIEIWSARTGIRELDLGKVPGVPTSIALSPDEMWIAAGANGRYEGGDGSLTIWNRNEPGARRVLPAYGAVTRVAFSPTGDTLYFATAASSCSRGGGGVFAWKPGELEAKEAFSAGGMAIVDFSIHPQRAIVASISQTGGERCTGPAFVVIWDTATGRVLQSLPPTQEEATADDALSAAFSPDGKWLAVGDRAGNLTVWDWEQAKPQLHLELSSSGLERILWGSSNMVLLDDQDGYVRLLHLPWR